MVHLTSSSGIVYAIIATRTGSHTVLFTGAAITGPVSMGKYQEHIVPHSAKFLSSATLSGGGAFVALSSEASEHVEVQADFNGPWAQLPTPDGTETVAFALNGRVDAFVPKGSVLTKYTLDASQGRWRQPQVIKVPIQYGSSS